MRSVKSYLDGTYPMKWLKTVMGGKGEREDANGKVGGRPVVVIDAEIIDPAPNNSMHHNSTSEPLNGQTSVKSLMEKVFTTVYSDDSHRKNTNPNKKEEDAANDSKWATKENLWMLSEEVKRLQKLVEKKNRE